MFFSAIQCCGGGRDTAVANRGFNPGGHGIRGGGGGRGDGWRGVKAQFPIFPGRFHLAAQKKQFSRWGTDFEGCKNIIEGLGDSGEESLQPARNPNLCFGGELRGPPPGTMAGARPSGLGFTAGNQAGISQTTNSGRGTIPLGTGQSKRAAGGHRRQNPEKGGPPPPPPRCWTRGVPGLSREFIPTGSQG